MIINNIRSRLSFNQKTGFVQSGVIFDSHVLLVLFVSMYLQKYQNKSYILNKTNVTSQQINCLNDIRKKFNITRIIITPHILTEFLNRLRREAKQDYKQIKKEFMVDLMSIDEIPINKNDLCNHDSFIDFGADISLLLATEEHLKKNKYSCIISFDGRFIEKFFDKNACVLAFNLGILQYYY